MSLKFIRNKRKFKKTRIINDVTFLFFIFIFILQNSFFVIKTVSLKKCWFISIIHFFFGTILAFF